MSDPTLNNFGGNQHRSFWRRFWWAIILGVLILFGIIWYAVGALKNELIVPATPHAPSTHVGTSTPVATKPSQSQPNGQVYDYTQAINHIGVNASVIGKVVSVSTSSKGTIYLEFCTNYKTCPFSTVIFKSNASAFPHPSTTYTGKTVIVSGVIESYDNAAEIIVNYPPQLSVQK